MKNDYDYNFHYKLHVYRWYEAFGLNKTFKNYDRLTRKVMIKDIHKNYKLNPEEFEGALSIEELDFLLKVGNKKLRLNYKNPNKIVLSLRDKLILLGKKDTDELFISDEIKKAINNYRSTGNHQRYELLNLFFKGILYTKGEIYYDELEELYSKLIPADLDHNLETDLYHSKDFLSLINIEALKLYEHLYLEDDFTQMIPANYAPENNYSLEAYLSIGENGFDLTNKAIKRFYNEAVKSEDKAVIKNKIRWLFEAINQNKPYHYLFESKLNDEKFVKLYEELLNNVSLWHYSGDRPVDIGIDFKELTFSNQPYPFDSNDECGCGSGLLISECCLNIERLEKNKALLNHELRDSYFAINGFFINVINQEYGVIDIENNSDIFDKLTLEERYYLNDLVYSTEDIFKNFIEDNNLNEKELEVVKSMDNAINGEFVILGFNNQKLVVGDINSDKKYLVSSISIPFGLIIKHYDLPILAKMRLLPFKDRIVSDHKMELTLSIVSKELFAQMLNNFKDEPLITKFSDLYKSINVN